MISTNVTEAPSSTQQLDAKAGLYATDLSRHQPFVFAVPQPHYLGDCVAPYYATMFRRGNDETFISYHQVSTPWEWKDLVAPPKELLRRLASGLFEEPRAEYNFSKMLMQVVSQNQTILAAKPVGFVYGSSDEAAHPQAVVIGGMTFTDSYDRERRMGNIHFGPFPFGYSEKNLLELTRRLHCADLFVPGQRLKFEPFVDPKVVNLGSPADASSFG